jgi:hypothetical protein
MALPGKIEAGHHTRVLVETRAFGQSSERPFDRANARLQFQIGQTLFIEAAQREQASIAAAFQGEDARSDKTGDRDNARSRPCFGKPRDVI